MKIFRTKEGSGLAEEGFNQIMRECSATLHFSFSKNESIKRQNRSFYGKYENSEKYENGQFSRVHFVSEKISSPLPWEKLAPNESKKSDQFHKIDSSIPQRFYDAKNRKQIHVIENKFRKKLIIYE